MFHAGLEAVSSALIQAILHLFILLFSSSFQSSCSVSNTQFTLSLSLVSTEWEIISLAADAHAGNLDSEKEEQKNRSTDEKRKEDWPQERKKGKEVFSSSSPRT